MKDVLDFSWFAGSLHDPWSRLIQAQSAEAQAAQNGHDPDPDLLQSMSEEFRYHQDLLTAEETEAWLVAHDIDEDAFANYFARTYWLERNQPGPIEKELSEHLDDSELLELLRIDLVLAGEFDRLAEVFSWHIAALLHNTPPSLPPAEQREAIGRFEKRTGLTPSAVPHVLARLARDEAWLGDCLALEDAFRRLSAQWLTPEEEVRALASRRQGLTRIQIEGFVAATANAAEEAVLCLREEPTSLEQVAEACGATGQRREFFLEELDNAIQQLFQSASAGDVLHLPEDDSGFLVCVVAGKTEPDLTQSEVKSRIDQRLLETRFSELMRQHIQWVARPHER